MAGNFWQCAQPGTGLPLLKWFTQQFDFGSEGIGNGTIFYSLKEAATIIDAWQRHYNTV